MTILENNAMLHFPHNQNKKNIIQFKTESVIKDIHQSVKPSSDNERKNNVCVLFLCVGESYNRDCVLALSFGRRWHHLSLSTLNCTNENRVMITNFLMTHCTWALYNRTNVFAMHERYMFILCIYLSFSGDQFSYARLGVALALPNSKWSRECF